MAYNTSTAEVNVIIGPGRLALVALGLVMLVSGVASAQKGEAPIKQALRERCFAAIAASSAGRALVTGGRFSSNSGPTLFTRFMTAK